MKTYLIALDLDGSLLNNRSELSDRTASVIKSLKELGHIIVIATGRPFSGAISYYRQLGLNTPLITDNGGSIENPVNADFAKQRTYIPLNLMHQLFTFSKPILYSAFFSVNDVVYAYQYDPRLAAFFSGVQTDKVIEGDFTGFAVEPTGMVFLIYANEQKTLEHYIDQHLSHTLNYRLWGSDRKYAIYEIYLKHVSKYSALSYLLEHYNLEPSQLMTFGDGINDVEMIGKAHLGVAMKNANPEVKQVAKVVSDYTNDEDAIARFLIDYFKLNL